MLPSTGRRCSDVNSHEELIEEAESWVAHTKPSVVGAILRDMVSALESVRAERDAALSVLERIREVVSGHPECDRYEEGDVISCGWKSAYASVLAALDGAPELDDGEQQGFIDAVEGALYEVEGRHHIIGNECLCGEKRLVKNRDKTKHIARETIAALMGREVLDDIRIQ